MSKEASLTKRFKRTLLSGIFVVGPFSLTFMILAWFVSTVDKFLAPVAGLFGRNLPGIGLVVALLIVLGLGALANNIMGQHLLEYFEELLLKIPGFNWVYSTIKQMTEVFSPANKNAFRRVVLVEYPRPAVYSLGFVTRDLEIERGGESRNFVCVYVPTNHMYIGDIVLVPESQVFSTPLTLQEGIQCAVSAGASLPTLFKFQ
ncbi:MAG: DUF502 domain-containing protein [Elusimicrobia bacterium]|nr:DUF502 domain-containing protein [Elusimicrobiota bacterium]